MRTQPMSLVACLECLRDVRTAEVIVTSMGVAREWMKLSEHPLDFHFVPSSMGQATSLGQGIALAQPHRKVIVCVGDGSLLMNLGSLVSMTAAWPHNLIVLLFDNGVYEVTGGQLTPGADLQLGGGSRVDFAAVAVACGFKAIWSIDSVARWREVLPEILVQEQPVLAVLKVAPVAEAVGPKSPGPARERAIAFRAALTGQSDA